jgi:hypothetical protein
VATIREAVASVTETVRERFGIGLPSDAAPDPVASPAATAARRPRGSSAPSAPAEIVPDVVFDVSSLLPPVLLLPVDESVVVDGGLAVPPGVSGPPPVAASSPVDDGLVYTSGDGAQPPVMVSPQLPPVPVTEHRVPGTNTMELLIDETGRVERVRLVSEPVRMSDMMLLSGAKTWRFHPALKDGRPVKYRLTLSWIVAPP